MSDWSVERVARVTSAAVAVVCLGLVFWSYVSGTRVAAATVHEQRFEKTAFKKPHMTFDLGEKTPVELTVRGPTLDDSWVWTKIVIVDEKDRPVYDGTLQVQYYSGRNWEEGQQSKTEMLVLPAGSYKVFVHGEDAKRDQVWTDEHRERVKVEVEKGVVLARYGIVGLIVAAGLFLLFASGGRGSDTFVSGSSDAELDVDFDAGADGDEF